MTSQFCVSSNEYYRFDYLAGSGAYIQGDSQGPIVGGTNLKITGELVPFGQDVPNNVNFFCKFNGDYHEETVPAHKTYLSGLSFDGILCHTPFWGREEGVELSFIGVFDDGFCEVDLDILSWNTIVAPFQYFGDDVGVIVNDTPVSSLITVGEEVKVEWNTDALSILAEQEASQCGISMDDVDVEIEVYAVDTASPLISAQRIQIIPVESSNIDPITLDLAAIEPFLTNNWGIQYSSIAVVTFRIVAKGQCSSDYIVLATQYSNPVGVMLPISSPPPDGTCPLTPESNCTRKEDPFSCPSTYIMAIHDFNFDPDEACDWPSGSSACSPADLLEQSLYNACTPYSSNEICLGLDSGREFGYNGCPCNSFRPGAHGCVRRGQSQCCYAESGALITQARDGAGAYECVRRDGTLEELMKHFIYDMLPFSFCCVTNPERCDDYYNKRSLIPAPSDEDYVFADFGSTSFGDPHLETIDGSLNYDFNGGGEYVFFCGAKNGIVDTNLCGPSSPRGDGDPNRITVHVRFSPKDAGHLGTYASAIAIEHPDHKGGAEPIVITADREAFDGDTELSFPSTNSPITRTMLPSGIKITRTADINSDVITFRVVLLPTVTLVIVITEGVLGHNIILREMAPNSHGLVASITNFDRRALQDDVNMINSDGDEVTVSFESMDDGSNIVTSASDLEAIFNDFGKSWMVDQKSSSLFDIALADFDDFNTIVSDFIPDYVTGFGGPTRSLSSPSESNIFENARRSLEVTEPEAIAECERVSTSDAALLGCIFDMYATNDIDLVSKTTAIAEELKKEVQIVVRRSVIEALPDRNLIASSQPDNTARFEFEVGNTNGRDITASFLTNELDLFEISSPAPNEFVIDFDLGSEEAGTYSAQVTVSDGLIPILITATVTMDPGNSGDDPATDPGTPGDDSNTKKQKKSKAPSMPNNKAPKNINKTPKKMKKKSKALKVPGNDTKKGAKTKA